MFITQVQKWEGKTYNFAQKHMYKYYPSSPTINMQDDKEPVGLQLSNYCAYVLCFWQPYLYFLISATYVSLFDIHISFSLFVQYKFNITHTFVPKILCLLSVCGSQIFSFGSYICLFFFSCL